MDKKYNQLIDVRGLECPQPILTAKKTLEIVDSFTLIVSNQTVNQNVSSFVKSMGYSSFSQEKDDGIYIYIDKQKDVKESSLINHENNEFVKTGTILVVSKNKMGEGDDTLGQLLIRLFFHTITETPPIPEKIVFFNSGVKLALENSEVLSDLKALENRGATLLICGTCLDFFQCKDKIAVGKVSNLYDLKEILFSSEKVINI